ncbi:MAG: AMP-binding protein [Actinophytocola sp.]|nr:AMP-binding protein [Actinophytocola sp.]
MAPDAASGSATLDAPAQAIGVGFARDLHIHGGRTALIDAAGTRLTYRELAAWVAEVAKRLGTQRRLVLLAARNDIDSLVSYLAALSSGHPVLLTGPDDRGRLDALISAYDPDVVFSTVAGHWRMNERRPGSSHELHPDLALLLSTSGTTGSPKLVRLSVANLQSNAAAIADYLGIRDTDRAVTSLPMQYCYGLSVINSNLLAGAALLLTSASVVDDSFWSLVSEHQATSLHGVPYTFDLLDRAGFEHRQLPSLRYVTQAGGRLAPDRVRRYAELGQRDGWRLFVMYGQTEATARMAYLPPELAAERPDAVGVPIPGGAFQLDTAGETTEGELIYHGPNVMLGYATSAADLALGRTVTSLATGDIARRTPDGIYQVIGRASRFIKPFGLRIDLDEIERLLADEGHVAACAGDDDGVIAGVVAGEDVVVEAVEAVGTLVSRLTGLPRGSIDVRALPELPRLSSGKLDYAALARTDPGSRPRPRWRGRRPGPRSIRQVYAKVLPRTAVDDIDDDATFVTLGGDSMSYVRASVELEKMQGRLPARWPTMPVAELERLPARRMAFPVIETNIVLRALAIVLVVGTHVGLFRILGGAHLLLVLAGWSFARFCLPTGAADGTSGRILRSTMRIAIPSMLWLGWRAVVTDDVGPTNMLLINNYWPLSSADGYWFVEVLVQTLLVLSLLFSVPAVRRFEQRHRFLLPLLLLGGALGGRLFIGGIEEYFSWAMTTHAMLWFFALGWLAYRARGVQQKVLVAAIALVTVPGFFHNSVREGVIIAGLLLLLLVAGLRVPRPLVAPIGWIASASLYIYLAHYALLPDALDLLPALPVTLLGLGLALGVVIWFFAERGVALLWRVSRVARASRYSARHTSAVSVGDDRIIISGRRTSA